MCKTSTVSFIKRLSDQLCCIRWNVGLLKTHMSEDENSENEDIEIDVLGMKIFEIK